MSRPTAGSVACPRCGSGAAIALHRGIAVTRRPELREAILAGEFQTHPCASCGARFQVECPAVYTDFARGHYVVVGPAAATGWRAASRHQRLVADSTLGMARLSREPVVGARARRLVPGLAALREKLLVWDGQLSEHVLEALKLDVLLGEGLDPARHVLRLCAPPSFHDPLVLSRHERQTVGSGRALLAPDSDRFLRISRRAYDRRLRRQSTIRSEFPWLYDEWLVDATFGAL